MNKEKHFNGKQIFWLTNFYQKRVTNVNRPLGQKIMYITQTLVNEKICRKHPGPDESQTHVMLS